jgi:hypothetical protein
MSKTRIAGMTVGNRRRFKAVAALMAGAGLFVLVPPALDRTAHVIAGLDVRATGQFVEHGEIPMNRGDAPDGERQDGYPRSEEPPGGGRFWSSWNGSNACRGEIALGPFPAPGVIGLDVCGYTHVAGNGLCLENTVTHGHLDLTEDNIGGNWCQVRQRLPPSWRGQPVVLHAVDDSSAYFGWMAVGEPRDAPATMAWWNSFVRKLLGFAGAGIVLFLLYSAASSLLRGRREIPAAIVPLASFALVALAAYGVFWVFFASALAGKVLVWALLAGSAWIFAGTCAVPSTSCDPEHRIPVLLMAAIGCLYVGLLLLYGSDRTMSDIASRRFINNLAVDNELPQMFADRLIHGEDPRHLAFGWWLSSDRPPLQTGTDLLIAYPVAAAGEGLDTAAQSAGIWMQLIWVCAAWAWLRTLGMSTRASALVIALIAPTGFLMLNTVYVWPKLLAGALTLGAFSIWLSLRSGGRDGARDFAAMSVLASLGFLAQEGAAFSMLAWLPLAAVRAGQRRLASWAAAAAVFAVLVLPWFAYQHYYNPPANLLIKWHLGGANIPDERGTWETIRSSYRSRDLATLLRYRVEDFAAILRGPWLDRLRFQDGDLAAQRNGQYFGVFFALGPWILGMIPLGALSFLAWRNRGDRETIARLSTSACWCLLTLAVWAALMFLPGSTVIHQGSYACVLLLLLCGALALWLAHPAAFILVSAAALVDFARVWILPNPTRISPLHEGAAIVSVLSCAALAAIVSMAKGQGPKWMRCKLAEDPEPGSQWTPRPDGQD